MTISEQHPQYIERTPEWSQMGTTYKGELAVKSEGEIYLPPTSGMVLDGMTNPTDSGSKQYDAYKTRAVFPEEVKATVESMVGIMHTKPTQIILPPKLENIRTLEGETMTLLLRKINEAQLLQGRFGLMVDVNEQGEPVIVTYEASSIINWDTNFVVLDESGYERQSNFSWKLAKRFRLLATTTLFDEGLTSAYGSAVYTEDNAVPDVSDLTMPNISGTELEEIPFVFINTNDLVSAPDNPPLLGLSNVCLTIYRGEADYRQTLFMQGQETLVVKGGELSEGRVGAGALLSIPIDADAKYIGVSAAGLSEMRQALENDRGTAANMGARLLDTTGGDKQSGEALRIRVAAQTASLRSIVQTSAEGLEKVLKIAALWVGADPEKVEVIPNVDFSADEMTGQDLLQLTQARTMGAPMSEQSLHALMRKRDMTTLDYDAEKELMDGEF